MDQLKEKFNRVPGHSIAAGLSTISSMLIPRSTIQEPVLHNSIMQRTNNRVRQGLTFMSPVTAAIPLAGTPLKASIDALLVVFNGINTRAWNCKIAASLIRHLYRLEAAISAVPPATPSAQFQRDELVRKLNALSARVKGMHVKSILGSADIKQDILDCITEIGDQMQEYIMVAVMRMEYSMQEGAAQRLPGSVQQGMAFVRDATGREYKLLVEQCQSRERLIGVLLCYFGDTDRDRVLRNFIDRGAYDLYTEAATGITRLDGWLGVGEGARIVMSAVLEQSQYGEKYMCPRPQCKAWNRCEEAKDGWIDW